MIVPTEKIYERFDNKYKAVNVAALEARKLKDDQIKGLLQEQVNPIFEALRKLIAGKIRYIE
ncbi:MAG TPA: DNA-directed RNA polymerase subunit omega [candidate division WOR-3 bacterium]|uniref:DNA-directed RNA polymerase subunit omega n=1 Tax=candidate division WOR-3 bacterium TaxID=2052148 RepID=A0A9C9K0G5_UNCW3|nr:DNA-directed RNA polymerase subunit omega [candidate division WOR-3 bacterium]